MVHKRVCQFPIHHRPTAISLNKEEITPPGHITLDASKREEVTITYDDSEGRKGKPMSAETKKYMEERGMTEEAELQQMKQNM